MRPKGMQYVPTLLGTGVSKVPGLHESATATGNTGSRAQAASEYARLERERVRLEDKLSALAVVKAQTEVRLEALFWRLAIVRRQLDEIPGEAAGRPARPTRTPRDAAPAQPAPRAAEAAPEEEDDLLDPYEIVPFEY